MLTRLPLVLVGAAFLALLLAPGGDGLFLVLVWSVIWAAYRLVAAAAPDVLGRLAVNIVFLVLALAAAFEGGWFLVPAGLAYLVLDLRSPLPAPPRRA